MPDVASLGTVGQTLPVFRLRRSRSVQSVVKTSEFHHGVHRMHGVETNPGIMKHPSPHRLSFDSVHSVQSVVKIDWFNCRILRPLRPFVANLILSPSVVAEPL